MSICIKITSIIFSFFLLFASFLFFVPQNAFAQTATSCWITDFGNPDANYPVPPECAVKFTQTGVISPPNITECITVTNGQYCKMPPALNNEYIIISHDQGSKLQNWGSKDMINVLYTVAQNWKHKHPKGFLIIGDIASSYHGVNGGKGNHYLGIAADVAATTDGHDCVANHIFDRRCTYGPPYNPTATVEFGELFMNTGKIRNIIFYDKSMYQENNQNKNVIAELKTLAKVHGLHAIIEKIDHQNHFHIDLNTTKLPGCDLINPKAC